MKQFLQRFQFLKSSAWLCGAGNLEERGAVVITQDITEGVGELSQNLAGSRWRAKVQIAKLTAFGKLGDGEKILESSGWKESTNSLIEMLPSAQQQVNKWKGKHMYMNRLPCSPLSLFLHIYFGQLNIIQQSAFNEN